MVISQRSSFKEATVEDFLNCWFTHGLNHSILLIRTPKLFRAQLHNWLRFSTLGPFFTKGHSAGSGSAVQYGAGLVSSNGPQ
jgi:hypothetical protein